MGIKNYLIDGISGTGKTSVAEALDRLGHHVVHGDRELKYRGDPETGQPLKEPSFNNAQDEAHWKHQHLLWDRDKVQNITADKSFPATFFCGGCRNIRHFKPLFDHIFILDVQDITILFKRMDDRVAKDPTDFGGKPEEKALVARLHDTKEDLPKGGTIIDATQPLQDVVQQILNECNL